MLNGGRPRSQAQSSESTVYGVRSPSRRRSGNMVKTARAFAKPIQALYSLLNPFFEPSRSVRGKRGSKIDFSWTWKLKRKKLNAQEAKA